MNALQSLRRVLAGVLAAALAAVTLVAAPAQAQPYPSRLIKIVVPYPAGGAVDIVARIVGQALAEQLKQTVVVDNRPGASANIGMEAVAKAPADGYTLLMASNGLTTNMALFPNLSFDGRRDFTPIARIGYAPLVIVVPAASPAKSLKDLIAVAKAKPGDLAYGSAGNGSSGHLAGELLKSSAGIDVLHVPYKGGAPADHRSARRAPLVHADQSAGGDRARAGRVGCASLAVGSDKRVPLLPDVPTVSEAGLPGFEATVWWGLVAPAKTPADIVARLNAETNKALHDPAIDKKLADLGVVATPGSPEDFANLIARQTEIWSAVIRQAGIRPD